MLKRLIYASLLMALLAVGAHMTPATTTPYTSTPALAQSDDDAACQTLVRDALRAIGSACANVGVNEVCYGNTRVSATLNDPALTFEQSGDTVTVTAVDAMVTRAANPQTREWGVALLNLRADLPATSGDTVRLVLFGETEVQPAAQTRTADADRTTCTFSNTRDVGFNLRSGPGLDFRAVDILDPGETLDVYATDADSDWLRSNRGWVAAELGPLTCEGDDVALPTVDATTDTYTQPMQAFSMTITETGECDAAPSGLLVQAPENQTANILVNDVELRVGSTALLFPGADGDLNIGNLGGDVDVTVNGQTSSPTVGEMTNVSFNEDGTPSGSPSTPETLDGVMLDDEFLNTTLSEQVAFVPGTTSPPTTTDDATVFVPPADTDNDGINDADDACPTIPNDAIGDPCNPDDDLDGIPDAEDPCPFVANDSFNDPCNNDEDGDGINDVDDACPTIPGEQTDDFNDPCNNDEDGDGVLDDDDACPTIPNDGFNDPCNNDEDGDGVLDDDDACPTIPNDGFNDPCNNDEDGDGVLDDDDACPTIPNDDFNDPCNNDEDGDGVLDDDDPCPAIPNDDFNDPCNNDEDGDGVLDDEDDCPTEPGTEANKGCPILDTDDDGVPDVDDLCPTVPDNQTVNDTFGCPRGTLALEVVTVASSDVSVDGGQVQVTITARVEISNNEPYPAQGVELVFAIPNPTRGQPLRSTQTIGTLPANTTLEAEIPLTAILDVANVAELELKAQGDNIDSATATRELDPVDIPGVTAVP